MAPATTSARPAVTIREGEVSDNPATKANGTVRDETLKYEDKPSLKNDILTT